MLIFLLYIHTIVWQTLPRVIFLLGRKCYIINCLGFSLVMIIETRTLYRQARVVSLRLILPSDKPSELKGAYTIQHSSYNSQNGTLYSKGF